MGFDGACSVLMFTRMHAILHTNLGRQTRGYLTGMDSAR